MSSWPKVFSATRGCAQLYLTVRLSLRRDLPPWTASLKFNERNFGNQRLTYCENAPYPILHQGKTKQARYSRGAAVVVSEAGGRPQPSQQTPRPHKQQWRGTYPMMISGAFHWRS